MHAGSAARAEYAATRRAQISEPSHFARAAHLAWSVHPTGLTYSARLTNPTRFMHVTPLPLLAIFAIETLTGETLADTSLQLRVAARWKKRLRRHAAGIVLTPASLRARIGKSWRGRNRRESEQCDGGASGLCERRQQN